MGDVTQHDVVLILVKGPEGYFLQHRDDKPGEISASGTLSGFGGRVGGSDKSFRAAAIRELTEETNLDAKEDDLEEICHLIYDGNLISEQKVKIDIAFYLLVTDRTEIEVFEGSGYEIMPFDARLSDYNLAPVASFLFREYLEKKKEA